MAKSRSISKGVIDRIVKGLEAYGRARAKERPTQRHISLFVLDEWGIGDRPYEFLEEQEQGAWKQHLATCKNCRNAIAHYRLKRSATS